MSVIRAERLVINRLKAGAIGIKDAQALEVDVSRYEMGTAFGNLKRLGVIAVDCGKVYLTPHGQTLLL